MFVYAAIEADGWTVRDGGGFLMLCGEIGKESSGHLAVDCKREMHVELVGKLAFNQ